MEDKTDRESVIAPITMAQSALLLQEKLGQGSPSEKMRLSLHKEGDELGAPEDMARRSVVRENVFSGRSSKNKNIDMILSRAVRRQSFDQAIFSKRKREKTMVFQRTPIGKTDLPPFLFSPFSSWRTRMNITLGIFVLYNAVVLPYEMAYSASTTVVKRIWDNLIDIFFIVDLVLNFFTVYKTDSGIVVKDRKKIASNYLKGWFLIDFPASFPFELAHRFMHGGSSNSGDLSYIALLKSLKLFRFGRLVKLMRLLESLPPEYTGMLRMVKIFLSLALVTHWVGCFFYMLCEMEASADEWDEEPWHIANDVVYGSQGLKYWSSAYYGLLILIADDPNPGTDNEIIFTVTSMLIGACLYATLFAQVSILVTAWNKEDNRFQAKLDNADEHMRNMGLPEELKQRVRKYYDFLWSRNKFLDREAFFQDLSPSLGNEMRLYVFENMVASSFFQDVAPFFLIEIAQEMRLQAHLDQDYIIRSGTEGTHMYFISAGICKRTFDDDSKTGRLGLKTILRKRDFFGELAALTSLNNSEAVLAVGSCELVALSKKQLTKAMGKYPASAIEILKLVKETVCINKGEQKAVTMAFNHYTKKLDAQKKQALKKQTGHSSKPEANKAAGGMFAALAGGGAKTPVAADGGAQSPSAQSPGATANGERIIPVGTALPESLPTSPSLANIGRLLPTKLPPNLASAAFPPHQSTPQAATNSPGATACSLGGPIDSGLGGMALADDVATVAAAEDVEKLLTFYVKRLEEEHAGNAKGSASQAHANRVFTELQSSLDRATSRFQHSLHAVDARLKHLESQVAAAK